MPTAFFVASFCTHFFSYLFFFSLRLNSVCVCLLIGTLKQFAILYNVKSTAFMLFFFYGLLRVPEQEWLNTIFANTATNDNSCGCGLWVPGKMVAGVANIPIVYFYFSLFICVEILMKHHRSDYTATAISFCILRFSVVTFFFLLLFKINDPIKRRLHEIVCFLYAIIIWLFTCKNLWRFCKAFASLFWRLPTSFNSHIKYLACAWCHSTVCDVSLPPAQRYLFTILRAHEIQFQTNIPEQIFPLFLQFDTSLLGFMEKEKEKKLRK